MQLSHHALWRQAVDIADGELAEVMLKSMRPRRRLLNPNARKRAQRAAAD
jgi:predicted membrane GTPase involved in stress response